MDNIELNGVVYVPYSKYEDIVDKYANQVDKYVKVVEDYNELRFRMSGLEK